MGIIKDEKHTVMVTCGCFGASCNGDLQLSRCIQLHVMQVLVFTLLVLHTAMVTCRCSESTCGTGQDLNGDLGLGAGRVL